VISASDLTKYLKHIERQIHIDYPNYEVAIKELNKYYDLDLVSFVVHESVLYIHIPIYLKLKQQPILDLYRVTTKAIPYDPAELKPNEEGEWIGQYTEVRLDKNYMAIGEEIYLDFSKEELDLCKKIGGMYYCENILMLKHISDHTCASAIFFNDSETIPKVCNVNYLENYRPQPEILETNDYILLIGMPSPWKIYCNRALDIPVTLKESSLAIIRRKDMCHCGFSSRNYYLHENILDCEDEMMKLASNIGIFYTVNTITADFFHKVMNDVNETNNRLTMEVNDQINVIEFVNQEIRTIREKKIDLSGNIITDTQIDLDSPNWKFAEKDDDIQIAKASVTKDLKRMIKMVNDGNKEMRKPLGKDSALDKQMDRISKWINLEKHWVYVIFALAIIGTLAFIINIGICKYVKGLKRHQSRMTNEVRNIQDGNVNLGFDPKIAAASLLAMTNLGQTNAFDVNMRKNNDEKIDMNIKIEVMDILYFIVAHLVLIVALYILYSIMSWFIIHLRERLFTTRRRCKNVMCSVFQDQTDVYLNIGNKECSASLKLYLGTVLGPVTECKVNNFIDPINIHLKKNFFQDELMIDWTTGMKITNLEIGQEKLYLTDKVKIPFTRKFLGRHIFAKKSILLANIVLVYGSELIVKNIQVVKALPTDVGTGLSISDTLRKLKVLPSTSKQEGEEYEIKDKGKGKGKGKGKNKNENDDKSKLMRVKCIHCNENTYLTNKNPGFEEYDIIEINETTKSVMND